MNVAPRNSEQKRWQQKTITGGTRSIDRRSSFTNTPTNKHTNIVLPAFVVDWFVRSFVFCVRWFGTTTIREREPSRGKETATTKKYAQRALTFPYIQSCALLFWSLRRKGKCFLIVKGTRTQPVERSCLIRTKCAEILCGTKSSKSSTVKQYGIMYHSFLRP